MTAQDKTRGVRSAVAERLRVAREHAGLSQGQVARLIGIHRPTVSEIEAGRRKVTTEELKTFAVHYRVSTTWLLGETPDTVDPNDARIQLAARELKKLKPDDLERVLKLLAAVRRDEPGAR